MNEQLQLLIELQKLDSAILSAKVKIDTIPSKISSEEAPLKNIQTSHESVKQKHTLLEKKKRDKEREIEDINEKIKKLKGRTSEIKTNKEYQAHLREIEKLENDIGSVEDELLSIMESLEESSKLMETGYARAAEEKLRIDAIKNELEKEATKCEDELKKLKEDRKKLTDKIDPEILNLYMNRLKTTQGLAVVEAKNEVCLGCNIHIPPQLFVGIKSNENIITCPQCRRVLYYVRPETDSHISAETNA
ncbi:MAG: hypothetical protein C0415_00295 [Thermodesulfovibrio sp.]|nr:hypothetical protein [Thermodesulfovibrio sp.]